MWAQLREPNLTRKVQPGWCLGYVSAVLGIDSSAYSRAWYAWQATQFKHGTDEPLPDVPVLVWFNHYGDYGNGWGQYGHVALHVPGVGVFTSPGGKLGSPASFEVWPTIWHIANRFNSTYVGWSEDLAGTRFAQFIPEELTKVMEGQMTNPIINVKPRDAVMIGRDDGTFEEYATPKAMNSRGIISVAFFGAKGGDKDLIPSLSEGDFQVVKTIWAQMCKGRIGGGGGSVAAPSLTDIAKAVNDDAAKRLAQ